MIIRYLLLILTVWLLAAQGTQAVGIAVTPGELIIETVIGEKTTSRLKVENPSSDVAVFEVYPDELESEISVSPASFTLESGEERYVTLIIQREKIGQIQTTVSVVAWPLANEAFGAGTGVKIPITIKVLSGSNNLALLKSVLNEPDSLLNAIIIIFGLVVVGLTLRKRKMP